MKQEPQHPVMLPVISKKDKELQERSEKSLISFILQATAKHYGLDIEDYKAHTRKREIVMLKQTAAYFIKQKVRGMSLSAIGALFNNLDHATVLYGTRSIARLADVDKGVKFTITTLEREINDYYEKIKVASISKDAIIHFDDIIVLKMTGGRNIVLSGMNASDNTAAIEFFKKLDRDLKIKQFKNTGMYVIDHDVLETGNKKDTNTAEF